METSLFDALAEFMGYPAYYTLYGGEPATGEGRCAPCHSGAIPARRPITAGTAGAGFSSTCWYKSSGSISARWFAGIEWIDDPFDTTPHRRQHRDILEPAIEEAFSTLSRAEVSVRLKREAEHSPLAI